MDEEHTGEKWCKKGKHWVKVEEFGRDRRSRDGLCWRCKACSNAAKREWNRLNPAHIREANLRRSYGITSENKQQRYEAQGGKCEVCGGDLGEWFSAQTDHDHESGAVRGLLCSGCNIGLGHFEGKAYLFAAYLRKYGMNVEVKIERTV